MTTLTRKDYLDGKCSHREYYGGIVKAAGIRFSGDHWLVLMAKASTDEHYNDIPLRTWDAHAKTFHIPKAVWEERVDFPSMAGLVCVAKEAVRQAVEREEER